MRLSQIEYIHFAVLSTTDAVHGSGTDISDPDHDYSLQSIQNDIVSEEELDEIVASIEASRASIVAQIH